MERNRLTGLALFHEHIIIVIIISICEIINTFAQTTKKTSTKCVEFSFKLQ